MRTLLGILRLAEVAARNADRAARRREREQRHLASEQIKHYREISLRARRAEALDAEEYNLKSNSLFSIHNIPSISYDWEDIFSRSQPILPKATHNFEEIAKRKIELYKPTIWDQLLGRTAKRYEILNNELKNSILKDQEIHKQNIIEYNLQLDEWNVWRDLANKILTNQRNAYVEALQIIKPFENLDEYFSELNFYPLPDKQLKLTFCVRPISIIPPNKKTILPSSKVRIKSLSAQQIHSMYNEYVSSLALKIAKDLFNLFPITNLFLVASISEIINSCNVRIEKPLLIVKFNSEIKNTILFIEGEKPSRMIKLFPHATNFKTTSGFSTIKQKQLHSLDSSERYFINIIYFHCLTCNVRYHADHRYMGKSARCSKCGQVLTVPHIEENMHIDLSDISQNNMVAEDTNHVLDDTKTSKADFERITAKKQIHPEIIISMIIGVIIIVLYILILEKYSSVILIIGMLYLYLKIAKIFKGR